MLYAEAKDKFLITWGTLGSSWGINKTMAMIQALLFISPDALTVDDIMDELQISRGNTSMNLRQLISWGIVYKVLMPGERKEYYSTIKDVEELARIIARERSRRELQPAMRVLHDVSKISNPHSNEEKEFTKQTKALYSLISDMDQVIEKMTEKKPSWLIRTLMKTLK